VVFVAEKEVIFNIMDYAGYVLGKKQQKVNCPGCQKHRGKKGKI